MSDPMSASEPESATPRARALAALRAEIGGNIQAERAWNEFGGRAEYKACLAAGCDAGDMAQVNQVYLFEIMYNRELGRRQCALTAKAAAEAAQLFSAEALFRAATRWAKWSSGFGMWIPRVEDHVRIVQALRAHSAEGARYAGWYAETLNIASWRQSAGEKGGQVRALFEEVFGPSTEDPRRDEQSRRARAAAALRATIGDNDPTGRYWAMVPCCDDEYEKCLAVGCDARDMTRVDQVYLLRRLCAREAWREKSGECKSGDISAAAAAEAAQLFSAATLDRAVTLWEQRSVDDGQQMTAEDRARVARLARAARAQSALVSAPPEPDKE